MIFQIIVVACAIIIQQASGHGMMMDPVSRSSAWRLGFPTPKNYDDNALFCGGFSTQQRFGGKCGVCGDPWVGDNAIRENEAGGKYATGVIVKKYKMGQTINIKIDLTANHWGWMEFRICPNNDPKKPVTHDCLNKHVLQRADGTGTKTMIKTRRTGNWYMDYKLPDGMTCTQCVIQWKYHGGNSWGVDRNTGRACLGCGNQEEFYGCADVSIAGDSVVGEPLTQRPTQPLPVPTTRPTLPPVVYTQPPVIVTKPPQKMNTDFIGIRFACKGTNNWANDPLMDKWCTDNCAIGNCPTLGCDCSGSQQLVTDKPTTTQRPTTKRPTTPSTTPTTPSTTPTTPSTTTTTTTPRPLVTQKITQPNTKIINHVECKAINNWEGNAYFDRVCADSCARGNCPSDSCACVMVTKVVTQSTTTIILPETTKPVAHTTKVCHALGGFAGNEVFDIWCTNECNKGVCPPNNCECTEVVVERSTAATTTTTTTKKPDMTSLGKCLSNGAYGNDDYWDQWCQQTCDRGDCESSYCRCGL